ncbi:MAG: mercuric reductase [Gemmatimonadetes bacterium]|nr:MAG: mercuric reductase [Gemmatimonadota bacterium]
MADHESFDAVVIGTGQAGKPLAGALAESGRTVAVIEKSDLVGGTCVVEGCTPTKTMVASARVAHLVSRAADYGVRTGPVSVDLEVVRRRKRDIVEQWSSGSRRGMERHETIDLIFGTARFEGPHEVVVDLRAGGTRRLTAPWVFINAGARAAIPPVPGLDETPFLTNASVMELGEVPEHLVVLGGGYIGLEFAQMFRRFGARVTVVEMAERLLPMEDEDVSGELASILEGEGVALHTGTRATRVTPGAAGGVRLELAGPEGDFTVEGSHLLVATGRRPNTDLLAVERAGLAVDERGYLVVDDELRTNVEGVWALGDINGGPPFTHVAYDDYRIVRDNLLGEGGASRAGRVVPYTLFTDPQLGRVGLSEAQARAAGLPVRVAKLPMSRVARAIETDETRGFMKAVVHAETGRILGAAVLGIEGGEVATVLQMAMLGDLPYTVLKEGVFSHPTLSESLNNLFMAMDRA